MPQSPFLIDQIDIEPGSVGTRRINRDAGTGGMAFQDAVVTSPITLVMLAGLRNIANVLIVGKSGAGAQYTTIQAALDVVPSAASAINPYIVLVMPGRYDETVNIVRDGVRLIGIGQPEIRSALEATPDAVGNDHTVIVSAQLGTIPLSTIISGFIISNVHTNKAAVRVVGAAASTVGSGGIILKDCDIRANGAGGNRSIWATACNIIRVFGGSWSEAANLGLLLIQEVATFSAVGVSGIGAIDLRYDTANDQPSLGGLAYSFTDCGNIAGITALATPIAVDLDGDGTREVIMASASGRPEVWDNPCSKGHWLEIALEAPDGNVHGVGASVIVTTADGQQRLQEVPSLTAGGQSPAALHFGLGDTTDVVDVTVRWPDGRSARVVGPDVDQHLTVHPD